MNRTLIFAAVIGLAVAGCAQAPEKPPVPNAAPQTKSEPKIVVGSDGSVWHCYGPCKYPTTAIDGATRKFRVIPGPDCMCEKQ